MSDDREMRREMNKVLRRRDRSGPVQGFPPMTFDQYQVLCYGALWRVVVGVAALRILWRFL